MFNQTGGTRRQEGREQEVVPGGDNDDIVVFGVELLQEGNRAPSRTYQQSQSSQSTPFCDKQGREQKHTQHDKGLLGRIGLDLLNGVSLVIDAVGQHTSETSTREQGQAPGPSQESELLLGFGGRGGISVGPASDALEGLLVVETAIGPQRWPGRTEDLAGGLEARQGREAHGGWRDHVGGGEVRW